MRLCETGPTAFTKFASDSDCGGILFYFVFRSFAENPRWALGENHYPTAYEGFRTRVLALPQTETQMIGLIFWLAQYVMTARDWQLVYKSCGRLWRIGLVWVGLVGPMQQFQPRNRGNRLAEEHPLVDVMNCGDVQCLVQRVEDGWDGQPVGEIPEEQMEEVD